MTKIKSAPVRVSKKRGSVKYGTEIMKDEEVLLFMEVAIDNNDGNIEQAISDMRAIDSLLHIERLHLAMTPYINKTRGGNYRRGTYLSKALESVIDAQLKGNI